MYDQHGRVLKGSNIGSHSDVQIPKVVSIESENKNIDYVFNVSSKSLDQSRRIIQSLSVMESDH